MSYEAPLQPDEADVLATLTQLSSLNISHLLSDDDGIGPGVTALCYTLTSLMRLEMGSCGDETDPQVGGALAAALAPLTALMHLNISRRCLGDVGAAELVSLTSLEHLDSWDNGVSAVGVAALAMLSALTHLDSSENLIARQGATTLTALSALNALVLPMSSLGGADVLACLPMLASLHVRGCDFYDLYDLSDEEIGALGALTQLRVLMLWGTCLEYKGADTAAALAILPAVTDLHHEGVEGDKWLGFPQNSCTIDDRIATCQLDSYFWHLAFVFVLHFELADIHNHCVS